MVKASTETVLAALTANGLSNPNMTAFDGQRILVTNAQSADSVSLWKAPDLTPLSSFSTGPGSNPGSVQRRCQLLGRPLGNQPPRSILMVELARLR